jgi:sugar/nucleoside kinase (ribokinase family)
MGDSIIHGLATEGIRTEHVCRAEGPSPFTYIIVDRAGGTRTCIHTPGPPMVPDDLPASAIANALADAALVYFDGRLTETALVVAAAARTAGVPVLVEAERLRPNLEDLLMLADYVVTSKHFPQDWSGEPELADALLVTLARLPQAKMLITTLGARGSVLLERSDDDGAEMVGFAGALAALEAAATAESVATAPAGCYTLSPGALVRNNTYNAAAGATAADAAAKEAAANADAGNADRCA